MFPASAGNRHVRIEVVAGSLEIVTFDEKLKVKRVISDGSNLFKGQKVGK